MAKIKKVVVEHHYCERCDNLSHAGFDFEVYGTVCGGPNRGLYLQVMFRWCNACMREIVAFVESTNDRME